MRRSSLAVTLMVSIACLLAAQAPPQMPKPGPEHKRLGYFTGTWQLDGETKPGPFGPGGRFSGTDHNDWMEGGFFLVSRSDFKTPMGDGTGLAVFGYNLEQKTYTYNSFNSMGEAEHAEGKVEGDTWTWTSNENMGGKMMRGRFTVKEVSPSSYTFKFEMAPDPGDFSTMVEGKATKTK
jgi:uncharacterized protein DUF1579